MAFKFRRTMKIAPGLRVNLTHRGVSARVGGRGAGYTINANGKQHISAGIPGSGIHVSEQIAPARKRRKAAPADSNLAQGLPPSTAGEKFFMAIGALVVIGGLFWLLA